MLAFFRYCKRKKHQKQVLYLQKDQLDGQGGVNPYVNTFFPDDLPHLTD